MTKPVTVTIDADRSKFAYGVMFSAIAALEHDGALAFTWALLPDGRPQYTLHPARGAKPFVLRVLHEFAALCEK